MKLDPPHPLMCECPECMGSPFTPSRVMDRFIEGTSDVASATDPLDAELTAAALLSAGALVLEGSGDLMVDRLIRGFEAQASGEALAVLMSFGAIAGPETAERALAAADRLVARGVAKPRWADELAAPMTLGECFRLVDTEETASILCCSFRRSGRAHAFLLAVDHSDGATGEIQIMPEAFLPSVLAEMSAHESTPPVEVRTEQLEPAALRQMIVDGLEAQELRELAGGLPMPPPNDEDGQPGYQVLSVLLRARMNLIPAP